MEEPRAEDAEKDRVRRALAWVRGHRRKRATCAESVEAGGERLKTKIGHCTWRVTRRN